MRKLFILLFMIAAIPAVSQVESIPTVTGSNSGDGEIKLIVAAAQRNDDLNQERVDSSKLIFNYEDSIINSIDSVLFKNGAALYNTESDTFYIKESVVKIEGELMVTGHVTEGEHASGGAFISTPGTQTINTGGTFERLNEGNIAYTGMHLHDFTHDDGRVTYTRDEDINMTVHATISIESGETSQEVQFRIAKNGTSIEGSTMQVDFSAVNGNAAVPLLWPLDMVQNDYVEIWGTSDTNSDEFVLLHLTFFIETH